MAAFAKIQNTYRLYNFWLLIMVRLYDFTCSLYKDPNKAQEANDVRFTQKNL